MTGGNASGNLRPVKKSYERLLMRAKVARRCESSFDRLSMLPSLELLVE